MAFVACLVLVLWPLMAVDYPPIFDYANHLSRTHVIANLDRSAVFAAHFQTTGFLIPNVLADLLLLAFLPIGGVVAAGKMLLVATLVLTLSGAYALNRVLAGELTVWPLFVAMLLYNEEFFWGFLNYDFGLGLLLWGLACWLLFEGRGRAAQLVVAITFAIVIFLSHLIAFGLYAAAIAAIELQRTARRWPGWRPAVTRLAGSAAQFVPPIVLFFAVSPSRGLDPMVDFDFSVFGKIMPFARILSSGNPPLDIFSLGATLAFLGGVLATRQVVCHPTALVVGGLFFALVMILPYTMLGSYFLDSRITIAVALVLVAGLRQPRPDRDLAATGAIVLVGLVGFRTLGLVEDWRAQDQDYRRVVEALDQVRPGSVLVTAVGYPFELGDWVVTRSVKPAHEHTGHYATIRNEVLVPNIFARRGQNPLVFSSSLEELNRVAYNPVPRLYTNDDSRWLVAQVAPIAERRNAVAPPIAGVYIIGHGVPCERWPADLEIRLVHCDARFSLVEIIASDVGEAVP